MKKISRFIMITLILSIVIVGCTPNKVIETNNSKQESLLSTAIDVIEIIKSKDMESLSKYVHPSKGIRFTPYFNIDIEKDKVFTSEQILKLMQDDTLVNWGVFDGLGEPIELKFSDYYDRFIYDKDFANAEVIGNNTPLGKGNSTDNITKVYPSGKFIEFHFPGFESQYEGIDWASLRLVFEELDGDWVLVGIIHGQWTI